MSLKRVPFFLVLSALTFNLILHAQEGKRITAHWTAGPIQIDGRLEESDWELAEPVSDFVQSEPREGGAPTERTEVRVLFDDDRLYIGIYLYDSEPDKILINDLQRDFETHEGDVFGVMVDGFHQHGATFSFFTNAEGAKNDSQGLGDGRYTNFSWDGIWHTASQLQEDGWSCEIVIPFKTLRFEAQDNQVMGINFKRRIRRKNEDLYWSLVPRRYNTHRASLAGDLLLERRITPGRNLQVKPFATVNLEHTQLSGEGSTNSDPEAGVDVKYSLTPGLTLDLTYNTDFSQVEVDTEQINLTRFSLFFPEKRDFFLESASLFQFGDVPGERGPRRSEENQLFHSRRIGLSSGGNPLPLFGGARMTGRVGPLALGVMNIHQEETDEAPSNNFTVIRGSYDLMENSDVGTIFISREGGDPGDYNRTFGMDVNLEFLQKLRINSFVAGTQSPGLEANNWETKLSGQWDDGFLQVRGFFADVGENFNPEVGFVPRRGVRIYQYNLGLRPRPAGDGFLREIHPHGNTKYFTDRDNLTLTKDSHFGLQFFFRDRSNFEVSVDPQFERLREPFRLREGVVLPPGDYGYNEIKVNYSSDQSQLLSGSMNLTTGGFFDGDKTSIDFAGNLLLKPNFFAKFSYRYNDVDLKEGSFRADLYGVSLHYSLNPRVFADVFVQYNQDIDKVLTNIRFNWIHHPLSELSLVFTEERFTGF
ncbi:MAG: DUF5916 domain-containing protein, partial [Acidobacteriota bacterium]